MEHVKTAEQLLKCLKMTGSSHDGEALNAIRMANRQLQKLGLQWDDVIKLPNGSPANSSSSESNHQGGWTYDAEMSDILSEMLRARQRMYQNFQRGFGSIDGLITTLQRISVDTRVTASERERLQLIIARVKSTRAVHQSDFAWFTALRERLGL